MVLPFLQLVQCRDEQALWKLRRERHRKVDVSAMRHRAHESVKARVQNLRCAQKGTDKPPRNKPQERDQRTVESHRSRVEQNQGDNREPEHATWREHGYNHRHGNFHTTRRQRQRHRVHKTHELRHGAHCSQAQEPDFGRNHETRDNDVSGWFCERQTQDGDAGRSQEGSGAGTAGPAAAAAEKHARKEKEVAKLKQELHDRMAKIQSLEAVKQPLENDASEIQKRLEEAEMERDHAFNQMTQEQNPDVADQSILDVSTSEAAIKPIVDTWTSEAAHTIMGDPTQKQAWFREQLCKHMANLVHAATAHRQKDTAGKRVNRGAALDFDKSVLTEDENTDPNMLNLA